MDAPTREFVRVNIIAAFEKAREMSRPHGVKLSLSTVLGDALPPISPKQLTRVGTYWLYFTEASCGRRGCGAPIGVRLDVILEWRVVALSPDEEESS